MVWAGRGKSYRPNFGTSELHSKNSGASVRAPIDLWSFLSLSSISGLTKNNYSEQTKHSMRSRTGVVIKCVGFSWWPCTHLHTERDIPYAVVLCGKYMGKLMSVRIRRWFFDRIFQKWSGNARKWTFQTRVNRSPNIK